VQPDQAAPLDQTMPVDPGVPPEENPPVENTDEEKPPAPVATPPAREEAAEPEPPKGEPAPTPHVIEANQEANRDANQDANRDAKREAKREEKPFVASTPKQALLEKEAVRLVQLTQELKEEVDKAGANMLSLAALRKADEVQRLSRDLKEKMKDQGQVVAGKP
jgi:hypothetical protein